MTSSRESHLRWSERGSALLASLCFTTVLVISLGSYMTVCSRTLSLSSRAMQSSLSVQLAEVGMEEALWALNKNDWSSWTISGTTATRSLTSFAFGGGVAGSVTLQVTNYDGTSGTRTVTVTGASQQSDGTTVQRTLTSTSSRAPLFVNAISATTGRVEFKVGGTVDSYDSAVGDYAAGTAGFSAVISSSSSSKEMATVAIAGAQIKGYVATLSTGPSYGTGAKVIGPASSSGTKLDTTRISTSPYQPLFDEVIPSGAGTTLSGGTSTIGTAGATSASLYYASNLLFNGSDTLTVDGPVVIVVSGDLTISNNGKIRVTSNGSLRIHVAGDLTIGGNGIVNDTKRPKNVIIISTGNPYESYKMDTDTDFYGVIYTPVSKLTVTKSQTIYGAIIAKAVTFNASPIFHYDSLIA